MGMGVIDVDCAALTGGVGRTLLDYAIAVAEAVTATGCVGVAAIS